MIHTFQQKWMAIVTLFCLAVMVALLPRPIEAQDVIQLVDQSWASEFNQSVTFSAQATSSAEITEADLF
ncbi:MAG: hypothetical protein KDJ52_19155, partial [Anaerolineae bacterium]|nr:hypothetical protein [Anaerolineae bacterium]